MYKKYIRRRYPIRREKYFHCTTKLTGFLSLHFNEFICLTVHQFPYTYDWILKININIKFCTYIVAPGPVTLEFSPRRVIKGKNVTLRCNAQYLGRPQHPTRYSWFRDGHQIYHQNQVLMNPGVNSGTGINTGANGNNGGGNFNPEWFVDHVSLETRANFTCSAYNEGGVTYSEPVYIEVFGKTNRI